MTEIANFLGIVASIATAVGVLLAWWQIRDGSVQAVTTFEDSLDREYREICQRLPVTVLLGGVLTTEEFNANLGHFYSYIDLSNQQISLRQQNRIREATWDNWRDGIRGNLERPAFRQAWDEIKGKAPSSFAELRDLEKAGFRGDPLAWPKRTQPE
jgi:hypothetical protein